MVSEENDLILNRILHNNSNLFILLDCLLHLLQAAFVMESFRETYAMQLYHRAALLACKPIDDSSDYLLLKF